MKIFKMVLITIFIFIVFWFKPVLADNTEPMIKKIGEEYVVLLPEKMKQTLQKYDSTFTPWRQSDFIPSVVKIYKFSSNQTPFAVIGDFNGDKIKDVALEGHNKNTDLLVCILSSGKGYKVVEVWRGGGSTDPKKEIYSGELGIWVYLTYVPPGKISSPFEEKVLDLKTDAFQVNYFEKASSLYYFKGNKFLEYVTED